MLFQFQSRNGLIWTMLRMNQKWIQIFISIPQRSDLNYNLYEKRLEAKSRFQSRNGLIWTNTLYVPHSISILFQSRNGLIWTIPDVSYNSAVNEFQSRNGLIWTQQYINRGCKGYYISIPQRSDLNGTVATGKIVRVTEFQSRNGLIWTWQEKTTL